MCTVELFNLISIHPLWMTFNERPGDILSIVWGGGGGGGGVARINVKEGKGPRVFWVILIVSRGKCITNHGIQGDA